MSVPPIAAVQPAPAELRLAVGREVAVAAVALEHVDDRSHDVERLGQARGGDEVEVVGRRVVLGELAVAAAHQRADRQRGSPGELYWRSS